MSLSAGTKLGPYEIISPLGAGGMGEVYRAKDTRLGRDVAIKVIRPRLSADSDQLRRFEQEARAASQLNHPNILVVHDLGSHEGSPYIVSELLEGESLRDKLGAPLPPKRAVEYALQVAHGFASAHEKGIVHRDLKPENLFVTKDGQIKILDFGVAKLVQPAMPSVSMTEAPTAAPSTDAGVVMGTVGYMSPEQVLGKPLDARSDLFSLGVVLYEMLSGKRPFQRDTAPETMAAILREEPPELSATNQSISPGLDRIVRHCLEKEPSNRFQSARDVAFALESLTQATTSGTAPLAAKALVLDRRSAVPLVVAALITAATAAGIYAGRRLAVSPATSFKKLTFSPGRVLTARFTPDGNSVVYAGQAETDSPALFSTRVDGPVSFPLEPRNGNAVFGAHGGEMAIRSGTMLATVPLGGGTPREILEDVVEADWSPDGKAFAVVRKREGKRVLEYPIGKVLFETSGGVGSPRISPDGARVAFSHLPLGGTPQSSVCVAGASGPVQTLSEGWDGVWGVAWSPSGREVWFGAGAIWGWAELHAVDLQGRHRLLLPTHAAFSLRDVRRDGSVLLTAGWMTNEAWGTAPGESIERNVSWMDGTGVTGISADGRTLLLYETSLGGGPGGAGFLRRLDGSNPIRLRSGGPMGLSQDGAWALFRDAKDPKHMLHVVPTGPGEGRALPRGVTTIDKAEFFPDGRRILLQGYEAGQASRFFVQDVDGGMPQPLGPLGLQICGNRPISPDGRLIAAIRTGTNPGPVFVEVGSGAVRPIPGLSEQDRPLAWSGDGRSLFVREGTTASAPMFAPSEPLKIVSYDVRSGRKTPWKELRQPTGSPGISRIIHWPVLSADGRACFYTVFRHATHLYLVEGLK